MMGSAYKSLMYIKQRQAIYSSNNTHGKCWPRASWNVHISAFSLAGIGICA
jgi:hypothetical protein